MLGYKWPRTSWPETPAGSADLAAGRHLKVDVVKTHPQRPAAPTRPRPVRGRKATPPTQLSRRQVEKRLAASVGAEARSARMRAGLTQADVAGRVGIAMEVYGRLERGKMLPSVPTLFRLCLALQLSADATLGLVGVAASGATLWEEDSTERDHIPEMRRLMRTLRRLTRPQLKLMNLVASSILPPRR